MGLSVVLAPQNSEAAATAQYSPVPAALVRPSATVAGCHPFVADSDLAAAAAESIRSTAAAALDGSLPASPVVFPAATFGSGTAASCERAAGSGLAASSGSVCSAVVDEAGSRPAVCGDSAVSAERGASAGKGSAAARKSDFATEDSSGSVEASTSDFLGAASGDTLTVESDLTESAERAVPAAARCASVDRTKELDIEGESGLCCISFPVEKSLPIGITSPLYASTLRRKGIKVCEGRRFFSKVKGIAILATGQRDVETASRSESSGCIARSYSKSAFNISSGITPSYWSNSSWGSQVDSSIASTSGTSSSATAGPTSSSNSSCSSSATAGGTDSSRREGTGMFESGQCDAPASRVQAKEEPQSPTFDETQGSAATTRQEVLNKDRNRSDPSEESKGLRAAIGDGPLGKLLQRFGAGNSNSNFVNVNSSTSTTSSKNECSGTDVCRRAEEYLRKLSRPIVHQQQLPAQQQQPEQQPQHDDAEGKLGVRVLTSHADVCGPVREGHVTAPDDFPGTALLHSLQQQQLLQQHPGWHTRSDERCRRISDPASGGTAATMPLWMTSLVGVPDDSFWESSSCAAGFYEVQSSYVGSDALASSSFKHSNHHASLLVLTELQRLRGEMLQLQVAAAAAKPANIIIQNKTEVAASTETSLQQPKLHSEEPGVRERLSTWLAKFFSSRLNQVLVLCGLGLGCYMLLEHWRHTWRMAQLRRRVDSNIVLRGVQMLEETIGVRRPQSSLYY